MSFLGAAAERRRWLAGNQSEQTGWDESFRGPPPPSLQILGAFDGELMDLTIDFLLDMQTDEGGLRANTRIPIADLLSSFTGGLTLQDLGAFHELEVDAFEQFVNSLQLDSGGFMAAVWDESHDVEYTFYGLGCLALIANHHDNA